MKWLNKIRNVILGFVAYIIAHIHDYFCKHDERHWVYEKWSMSLKEHIENVRKYYD